jgi:hypothetical protein
MGFDRQLLINRLCRKIRYLARLRLGNTSTSDGTWLTSATTIAELEDDIAKIDMTLAESRCWS